ncbi:ROK family transcriptional regulator [Cellulomonas sp. PhB143]|uniref:ROK family transcriptional regulator n=1 Tax=Cellulomonas sp. PhB143 TaxID=2485186 RepID=UPI000F4AF316|nr:ROK family transcriptional regulator [Cellulomonas sp. PhB143]
MATMTRGTNLPQMAGFNQFAVLDAVRRSDGSRTRADLARITGLSAQTVTNATRRLIEEGLVAERELQRRSGSGRPGTALAVVPDSRYAVGVHLDPAAVVVALIDLAGDLVTQRAVSTPESERPEAVLDVVADEIAAIVEDAGVRRDRLVGVGVVTPGPIDRERGLVLDPPHLKMWHDVPLRDEVARRTGLPTLLDKDVLAVAAATLWFPDGGHSGDAAVVYAGTGVAVGVVSGGEVVRGVSGNAGEAGHLSIGRASGPCSCGRDGCLGGVLSAESLLANATARGIGLAAASAVTPDPILRADAAVDELRVRAERGEAAVHDFLADAGDALGFAVTGVCELLDLDTIVTSGPVWERLGPWLERGLQGAVDRFRLPGRHPVRVVPSVGGVHAAAIGAACLALDEAFTPRAAGLLLGS